MGNKMGIKTVDLSSTLLETDALDRAYQDFITVEAPIKYKAFEQWLWENYKIKWETGEWYTEHKLHFHDERMMSMFYLRYS